MKKQAYRDYATEAFRFWAREGGAETYRQKIWNEAVANQQRQEGTSGISKPSEAAIIRAEQAIEDAYASMADLEAVERTIDVIRRRPGGEDRERVIRAVYMAYPNREIRRGEIQDRVHRAEQDLHLAERTIYGMLGEARSIFAKERGLRG